MSGIKKALSGFVIAIFNTLEFLLEYFWQVLGIAFGLCLATASGEHAIGVFLSATVTFGAFGSAIAKSKYKTENKYCELISKMFCNGKSFKISVSHELKKPTPNQP